MNLPGLSTICAIRVALLRVPLLFLKDRGPAQKARAAAAAAAAAASPP